MLLEAMSQYEAFSQLNILVLGAGETMNRTWCFWDTAISAPYAQMTRKSWNKIGFSSGGLNKEENMEATPYWYLPGENFFNYFKEDFLPKHANITHLNDLVTNISGAPADFKIHTKLQTYYAKQLYNSAWSHLVSQVTVWQHFGGWFVEFEKDILDPEKMTLMDFNVPQEKGCSFMYVLPFTSKRALVEWTFFSPEWQDPVFYEDQLHQYIATHFKSQYSVKSKEWGKIPMHQDIFAPIGQHGEVQIGTLGGMVKPSTGYAFLRIREDSKGLAAQYFGGSNVARKRLQARFKFYDALMLWIIEHKPQECKQIFTTLFEKQNFEIIRRFMDEKTNLFEEISIFTSLPKTIFLKALWHRFIM